MKRFLPTLFPLLALLVYSTATPVQHFVAAFASTHPVFAAVLGVIGLIFNHWMPSPTSGPVESQVARRGGLGIGAGMVFVCACLMLVGCASPTEVVQQALTVFQTSKGFVETAKSLIPELQQMNPELAKEVGEYADLAGVNLDNLIVAGNAYLAKPSGDKYQNILNAVDALTASVDARVLAAAKISNPQSQQKVLAVLTVASVSAHAVLTILQARASRSQLKAVPVVNARVTLQEIKPFLNLHYARGEIAKAGYDANEVFSLAGL
jgi:hypothetical protein